jgi:hypothetical protein
LLQGKNELVGRAFALPQVSLIHETALTPRLQRYKLFNDDHFVGEILAAFHLREVRSCYNNILQ